MKTYRVRNLTPKRQTLPGSVGIILQPFEAVAVAAKEFSLGKLRDNTLFTFEELQVATPPVVPVKLDESRTQPNKKMRAAPKKKPAGSSKSNEKVSDNG